MRIGIVTTWFERGAAMVSRAYRDVLAADHDVFIYARAGETYGIGDPAWDTPNVTWGRRAWGADYTKIDWREFRRWVFDQQLDTVLFNEQICWAPIVLARRELPVSIGAYVDYYTAETAPLFRLYDYLICNTQRHFSVFAEHGNAHHVPWGTDLDLFRPQPERRPAGPRTFFLSGGMNPPRKGALPALQAFHELDADWRFLFHIQAPLSRYPAMAEICTADPRIEVVEGAVTAPGLYHRGDVYVYPALLDGIGLTVPEALACGLPVVATDNAPMNEFVKHGENGWCIPPHEFRGRSDGYYWAEAHCTVAAIKAALQQCVDVEDDLPRFRQAARTSAETQLNWTANSATMVRQFRDIADRRHRIEGLERLEGRALRLCRLSPNKAWVKWLFDRTRAARAPFSTALVYG